MTDEIDRAQAAEERFREQALAAQMRKAPQGESAHECVRCGVPIPEARRGAMPGVTRCVDCQQLHEQQR